MAESVHRGQTVWVEVESILERIKTGKSRTVTCGCAILILVAIGYGAMRWHVRASASGTLQQAEQYLRQRDNVRVRETLKWLLWFEPTQHRAWLISGISLNADRRFLEAIAALDRISENSESFEMGGIALAASLILDNQLERAESVLKRQLTRFPQSADARDRLVHLYLKQLRKRDASVLLMEHWHRSPDDFTVLLDLLDLEAKSVTPHDRVGYLEAVDQSRPHQAPVVLALARAYSLMGLTEQAREHFQAALKLRPHDSVTRILAAGFHLDNGDLATARLLLGLDPAPMAGDEFTAGFHDERYWFVRCRLAEQSGEAEEALTHLQKALTLRPKEETYLLMQAALLRRMGRVDQGVAAAREATQHAADRKLLMILSDKLDRNQPSPAHCLEIAELLERLGHPHQADDWRRVSQAVAAKQEKRHIENRTRKVE